MQVSRSIDIQAAPLAVWTFLADVEHAEQWISGIKSTEILETPKGPSIVGLKWRETREWMGKDAVETMWVTDAKDTQFYQTRAESHGSVYISRFDLTETGHGTRLTMSFQGEPQTFGAKMVWLLTGWMAKSALAKTMDKDLADIKSVAEKQS